MDATPDTESATFPELSVDQVGRLRAYGVSEQVRQGDVLFRAGQACYYFVVLETASAEIVRDPSRDQPEAVAARCGPRRFLGELNLITGQAALLTTRIVEDGKIIRIDPASFGQTHGAGHPTVRHHPSGIPRPPPIPPGR